MAVFEKKVQRRNQLDDTDVLTCTVESSQNIQGHTEYVIKVQRGPAPERFWHVRKRYRDFANLHSLLSSASGISLPLPPKRLIGNMDPVFVAERLVGLQNYLNTVLHHPFLSVSLPVKYFLDPDNYPSILQESALHGVSLVLRGEAEWEMLRPLPELGWRIRKHYFAVRKLPPKQEDQECLLSWIDYGPDMSVEVPRLQAAINAVSSLQGMIAVPSEIIRCNEAGCLIIRRIVEKGSLRDILCNSKIRTSFLRKYSCPKQISVFSGKELATYSYQILQSLATLHHKGVPYGHLHAGNVCIEKGRAFLLDVESGLLGLPSFFRSYVLQHRRLDSLPRIDMYCFGHLLFEMAFGHPLCASTLERCALPSESSSFPPALFDVLEQLLSSRALRETLPTVQQLLQHEFFKGVPREEYPIRQTLKLSGSVRETIKLLTQKIEERLRHDQKIVHHQRRLVRVQEMMSSEEEKKRRKQRWKQKERERQQPQQPLINGKSPERSDSPASTSTATSAGTVTPPSGLNDAVPIAPAPPPPPPVSAVTLGAAPCGSERSALLNSICAFKKSALRHTGTLR